jgi:hypothetical protein
MTPIDIGISTSESQAASTGSGATNIGGNTYGSSPVMWIVVGIVALFGLVLFLKLRK